MNKFYNYKVTGDEYALTEAEHKYIAGLIEKGKSGLVVLRKGELFLNLNLISSVHEITSKSEMERLAFTLPQDQLLKYLGKNEF